MTEDWDKRDREDRYAERGGATRIPVLMSDLEKAEAAIAERDWDLVKFYLAAAADAARETERELDELDGKIENLAKRLGAAASF